MLGVPMSQNPHMQATRKTTLSFGDVTKVKTNSKTNSLSATLFQHIFHRTSITHVIWLAIRAIAQVRLSEVVGVA
jgi:hypothetical protein